MVMLTVVAILVLTPALSALAAPGDTFPDLIPLPDGFRPEGIAVGRGTSFYAGSLEDGRIYRGDLRTGQGGILVEGETGRIAVGLTVDERSNYLFVAGGRTGKAHVYDAGTGEQVAMYQFTAPNTGFVNDAVATREAVFFTDSFRPFLYKVPLGPGGMISDPGSFEEIQLGGDFQFEPGAFNTNGIDATPNGKTLVIVHSTRGELYRVDPATGQADLIDLGTDSVPNGDGILLDGGKTLYVMQNRLNQIAVVKLDTELSSGKVVRAITNPAFDVPTTIAEFGASLYAVNARFGTPPTPETEYDVVQVSKR
jgi:sugar lactone lactonase YvrE